MAFWILLAFLIVQRITELVIAKRNERWMKSQGAYEAGAEHYKW
ncbi:MAG TPA: isoprenylcysteine carboxyl methyltransferase, partial [Bacillales bacterium]